jgi:hypothetical protein
MKLDDALAHPLFSAVSKPSAIVGKPIELDFEKTELD